MNEKRFPGIDGENIDVTPKSTPFERGRYDIQHRIEDELARLRSEIESFERRIESLEDR